MIDLHLHTTASDGAFDPEDLVNRVHKAGVRAFSITDHDTMAGLTVAAEVAASLNLEFLPGIEITSVVDGRDVHILAYFLDAKPPGLESFLASQREDRVERAQGIADRLRALGIPIKIESVIDHAISDGRSVGRPLLAQALVQAGHVRTVQDAFDRWLGDGRPAYVSRKGAAPADVVRLISKAGGISSLAHPGLSRRDDLIPSLAKAGLTAIEVYHPGHDNLAKSHYRRLAEQHKLAASGGSDFHGDHHPRARALGTVGLAREEFMILFQRLLLSNSELYGKDS